MASEKKINGVVYRFEPLTGWDAFDALDLLKNVVGPLLPLIEAVMRPGEDERTAAIARMAPDILRSHDGASFRALLEKLFENVKADGQPAVVGVKPQGLKEMFELAAFCIEKQFGDFFGEGGALLAGLLPAQTAP